MPIQGVLTEIFLFSVSELCAQKKIKIESVKHIAVGEPRPNQGYRSQVNLILPAFPLTQIYCILILPNYRRLSHRSESAKS
jgi:hypothetical protein